MTLLKLYATLAVTVVIFSTSHFAAKGVKVSVTSSGPYAVLGQRFVFTCTMSEASDISATYVFLRAGGSEFKYHRMLQNKTVCEHSPVPMPGWIHDRFSSFCGAGTNQIKSNVKKYIFVMRKVSKTDNNKQWWCEVSSDHLIIDAISKNITMRVRTIKLSMFKKSSETVLGKPLTVVCRLTNAVNLIATVYFMKGTASKENTVAMLHQEESHCSEEGASTRGYRPMCKKGTVSAAFEIKEYALKISKLASHDNTFWYCRLQNPETKTFIGSPAFRLTLWEDLSVSLSTSSRQPAYKQKFTLTCTLTNAGVIRASVEFRSQINGPVRLSGALAQFDGHCNAEKVYTGYKAKCGTGTEVATSGTKVYVMEIAKLSTQDNADWFCYVQDDDSGLFKESKDKFKLCSFQCEHGTLQEDICKCNCNNSWTGDQCDICSLKCKHGDFDNSICKCDCKAPWTGDDCETCSLMCENDGVVSLGCVCHCINSWNGVQCEICQVECENDGTLNTSDCSCYCPEGWSGDKCELFVGEENETQHLADGVDGAIIALIIIAMLVLATMLGALGYYKRRKSTKETIDDVDFVSSQEQTDNPVFSSNETDTIDEVEIANLGVSVREEDLESVNRSVITDTDEPSDVGRMGRKK
ncbi:uncharacterized protein LOC121386321 [Gigantopelta aegis]|uniref:uncharacterized protein LOC121386321 n=1 Tax=Gigantopelta aegis TaxID=1735272 RepID=UPI001B887718|nr:uncharacterized protein LOC121386321 [Gigantopelta aegis]XP_041373123.1 uncharacterized protein LOC121386321 [Gigantopelta aegis]